MEKVIEKCKNTKILGVIGAICLILGMFLPYISFHYFGYTSSIKLCNFWQGNTILFLAILNLLSICKDFIEERIPNIFNNEFGEKIKTINNQKLTLIATVGAAILALYLTWGWGLELFKNYSIGFYLLWIGIILLVIYAFVYKGENKEVTNINQYQTNIK